MQLKEVMKETGLSARAIKYYEEQKLITVKKEENGYRCYTSEDVQILRRISVYRKLGISIVDIRALLKGEKKEILQKILEEKQKEHALHQKQIEALKQLIEHGEIQQAETCIDYETIGQAILDSVPGYYGTYFLYHFMPYLQGKIETIEQQQAYENIISFWDHTRIHIPFLLRVSTELIPRQSIESMVKQANERMQRLLQMNDEDYEKLKQQTIAGAKRRNSFFMRYHPVYRAQKKLMKQLQDYGYNDVFLKNMMILSSSYRQYHELLEKINQRLAVDIGLHYDSDYNLVMHEN